MSGRIRDEGKDKRVADDGCGWINHGEEHYGNTAGKPDTFVTATGTTIGSV